MRYLPDGVWMQKADAYTIEKIGIPSIVLMEHAACKTIEVLESEQVDCSSVLIVCGSGKNCGDGFAIARLLRKKGSKENKLHEECCRHQTCVIFSSLFPITPLILFFSIYLACFKS